MHANSLTSPFGGATLNIVFKQEKRSFLARNLNRCGYLRVLFETAPS